MDLPGTPGLGSSPPTLWFFLPSFETRLGPPAVHWTLHQTATRNTKMSMCRTHIQRCKHTGTEVGERQGVSRDWPQGMSSDTKTRHLTLSGQFLFIGPVSPEPCCPLSLVQAWLSCILMVLTFAETMPCRYNDFTAPVGCPVRWWGMILKEKTFPGPPLGCCQPVIMFLHKIQFITKSTTLKERFWILFLSKNTNHQSSQ